MNEHNCYYDTVWLIAGCTNKRRKSNSKRIMNSNSFQKKSTSYNFKYKSRGCILKIQKKIIVIFRKKQQKFRKLIISIFSLEGRKQQTSLKRREIRTTASNHWSVRGHNMQFDDPSHLPKIISGVNMISNSTEAARFPESTR